MRTTPIAAEALRPVAMADKPLVPAHALPHRTPADLIVRRIKIVGSQQNGREYLYEALDYVAKGKVKVIAETYPLAQVNRAYDRVAEGKVRFRAVIVNNEQ